MYLAQLPAGVHCDSFRQIALGEMAEQLLQNQHVARLTLHFDDSDVAPACRWRRESVAPLPQVVVSVWVDSANHQAELVQILQQQLSAIEGYLVSESEVLRPPAGLARRTDGMTQICSFRAQPQLSQAQFLELWRNQHTEVALRTQSTFGYRQNLVVAPLTGAAKDHSAIVEEHFPQAAMDSIAVFFNAEGDAEKLQRHRQQMGVSCGRFIDPDSINVVHMSEYIIKS